MNKPLTIMGVIILSVVLGIVAPLILQEKASVVYAQPEASLFSPSGEQTVPYESMPTFPGIESYRSKVMKDKFERVKVGRINPLSYPAWEVERQIRESIESGELDYDYDSIIDRESARYNVPKERIHAIIAAESKGNPLAINYNANKTVDRGLMQINSDTAPWLAEILGIPYTEGVEFDPEINIRMGTYYLHHISTINPDLHYIFTAYNRGPSGAEVYFNDKKTYVSEYSETVHAHMNAYLANQIARETTSVYEEDANEEAVQN